MDIHDESRVIKCDLKYVAAIALEDISTKPDGGQMAMVLIRRDWPEIYALRERDGFLDQEYFDLAEALILEKKSKN